MNQYLGGCLQVGLGSVVGRGQFLIHHQHQGAGIIQAVAKVILNQRNVQGGVNGADLGAAEPDQRLFDSVVHECRDHIALADTMFDQAVGHLI